ncbi:cell division topological specificity factor MinE [Sodalis sp. CWE]|uniref:cell division topological specificity factor MinE n=1 Tax=Sodalis sp. CWE TaxID=2803816 RepID=UPI001C7D98F8|nr:cell division topological specificity factor MinE [Sodalis sp. CWE]MBX4181179.1 cell division topological specificity factor MinE [Sodalis sp. CWE]
MTLLNFFLSRKRMTAHLAKKRLQTIVAEQRRIDNEIPYLRQLKHEIITAIEKSVQINSKLSFLQIERKDKDTLIIALNLTLLKTKKS